MVVSIQVYDHPRVLSENATLACSVGSVVRLSWVVHLARHVGNALHVFGVTHLSGIGLKKVSQCTTLKLSWERRGLILITLGVLVELLTCHIDWSAKLVRQGTQLLLGCNVLASLVVWDSGRWVCD